MKARLLTASIALWLISIPAAICLLRMSSLFNTETKAKKNKPDFITANKDKDKIILLWHTRAPPP